MTVSLHFCPPLFHIPIPPWPTQRLVYLQVVPGSWVDDVTAACEMMTFDFDQECPLALCFCFLSASKHKLELRMGMRSVDGWPSPLSCDADVGRLLPGRYIIFCDNLFYKRCSELGTKKKNTWPFQEDIGKDSIYLKWNFCTVFLSAKQRSTKCPTWNSTKTNTSAVCEPSPRWPCSIAGLAVAVFIALPCVYSPVFFF